jgi:hypothetical protein
MSKHSSKARSGVPSCNNQLFLLLMLYSVGLRDAQSINTTQQSISSSSELT